MFVSNDLLAPIEINLQLAQSLSKDRLELSKVFLDICHWMYYEKKCKFFFTGKFSIFFQKICVFSNLLDPKEVILLLPQ